MRIASAVSMTSNPSDDEVLVSVVEVVAPEADGTVAAVLTAEVNVVDTVASPDTAIQR